MRRSFTSPSPEIALLGSFEEEVTWWERGGETCISRLGINWVKRCKRQRWAEWVEGEESTHQLKFGRGKDDLFLKTAEEPGGNIEPRFARLRLNKFGIDCNQNPVILKSARHRGTCWTVWRRSIPARRESKLYVLRHLPDKSLSKRKGFRDLLDTHVSTSGNSGWR